MSAKELVYVLSLKDKASGSAKQIASSFDDVTAKSKRVEDALDRCVAAQERLRKAQEEYHNRITLMEKNHGSALEMATEQQLAAWNKLKNKLQNEITKAEREAARASREAGTAAKDLSKAQEAAASKLAESARKVGNFGRALEALSRGNIRGAISALGRLGTAFLGFAGIAASVVGAFRLVSSWIDTVREKARRADMTRLRNELEDARKQASATAIELKNMYDNIDRLQRKAKEEVDFRVRVSVAERRGSNARDETAFQRELGEASAGAAQEMTAARQRQRLLSQGFATSGAYSARRRTLRDELGALAAKDAADQSVSQDVRDEYSRLFASLQAARNRNAKARDAAGLAWNEDSSDVTDSAKQKYVAETERAIEDAEKAIKEFLDNANKATGELAERGRRRLAIQRELVALEKEEAADMAGIAEESAKAEAAEKRRARAIDDAERKRAEAVGERRDDQMLSVGSAYAALQDDEKMARNFVLAPFVRRAETATRARESAEKEIGDIQKSLDDGTSKSAEERARLEAELVAKNRELLELKDAEIDAQRQIDVQTALFQAQEARDQRAILDDKEADVMKAQEAAEAAKKANDAANKDAAVAALLMDEGAGASTPAERRAAKRERRAKERVERRAKKMRETALSEFKRRNGSLDAITDFDSKDADANFEKSIAGLSRRNQEILRNERKFAKEEADAKKALEQAQKDRDEAKARFTEQFNVIKGIYGKLGANLVAVREIAVVDAGAGEGYTGP